MNLESMSERRGCQIQDSSKLYIRDTQLHYAGQLEQFKL